MRADLANADTIPFLLQRVFKIVEFKQTAKVNEGNLPGCTPDIWLTMSKKLKLDKNQASGIDDLLGVF